MPFGFPRRSSAQFKHIAHGLVPAATVAPRSAVPRTPPPRSPYPSPERPRSALAAAILMTSLTGRTVAMPQPRPRSYSESYSYDVKQESVIEPYATAAEVGLGEGWGDHSSQRLHSPSSYYSDEEFPHEEFVENLTDTEREPSPHVLKGSDETRSSTAVYAVINKGFMNARMHDIETPPPLPDRPSMEPETLQASESVEANAVEMPCPKVVRQTSANHHLQSVQVNVSKKDTVLEICTSSPRPPKSKRSPRRNVSEGSASDHTDTAHHASTDGKKERFDDLKNLNQLLSAENQNITIELKDLKKQVKGLQQKLKELGHEHKRLKEDGGETQREEELQELLSLREQAQELVDENDALKTTVHRLNVELSRYQTKYRPLSQNENVKNTSLPMRGPPPPWLLDMKYLSPLMLAYEDRMREKDSVIDAHEEEMRSFRARVEEVVRENEQLHQQLEKNKPTACKEWRQLQVQAKLVLDENEVLMKQFEVQQAKAKESHNRHIQEVSKLTKQLMLLETKKLSQEEELSELQKQLQASNSKYDELKARLDGKIAAEEHVAMVNELRSQLQEEQKKRQTEVKDLMEKLSGLQAENKSLTLEKTCLVADNRTLEVELEMTQKNNRKSHKKIAILKQHLEDAMEKEIAAHQYLANLIHLAENITIERDQLVHTAKSLENEKHNFLNKILGGHVRLGRLEEKVKVYKQRAALKVEDIQNRLTEQEEDFAGSAARYQREMKHLQRMLLDRQEALDEVLQQKREVEGELEIVWETTSQENRKMKEFLAKSLETDKYNASKRHQFESDGIPQKDSDYRVALWDSDVKLLAPSEDQNQPEHLR
ncbi:centrosomal protein of 89 kDa isoform X1 [Pleurodeles waltl]|uniref:centrosomal protein of 89 kDa isoform X1 n=1 Tax=Pleurodeles waltl TaxID=8319 RepID=UPI003709AC24